MVVERERRPETEHNGSVLDVDVHLWLELRVSTDTPSRLRELVQQYGPERTAEKWREALWEMFVAYFRNLYTVQGDQEEG